MAEPPPPGMGGMAVHIEGQHIGAPGTAQTLTDLMRSLNAVDVAQAAAKILFSLEKPGGGLVEKQRDLVEKLFPPDLAKEYVTGLEAGGDAGGFDVVFYPGQLLTLQKLAPVLCQPGAPTSFNEGADVGRFVAASAQVGDVRNSLAPDAETWDELYSALFAFRAGEIDKLVYAPQAAGRSYLMWLTPRPAWPVDVERPEEYCQRTFGMAFRRFMAVAAAPAIGRLDIDLLGLDQVAFNAEQYFASSTATRDETERIMAALTYRPLNTDPGSIMSDPATFWCFFDFGAKPFISAGEGRVAPCSLRHSFERATSGIFWMMHSSLPGQVGPLTTHFGDLFEDYCLRVAEPLTSSSLTVAGEIEYGPAGGRKRSSDILMTTAGGVAPARVFIECRAGRPPRSVFSTGDVGAFQRYLDDLIGKLGQLSRAIEDHLAGGFTIPGDLAGLDDAYLPVLVVDEPFRWTFVLRDLLDREIAHRNLFRDGRVSKPVVCSIDEFENAIFVCEGGVNIANLLRGYLLTDRADPLEQYVYGQAGRLQVPSATKAGWDGFQEAVRAELFG